MLYKKAFANSRLVKSGRLFFIILFCCACALPAKLFAHQSPNSLVFIDVAPGSVAMEVQLPVPELELAFGNNISKNPETLIERLGLQLREYLKAHIHAYVTKTNPWQVTTVSLRMDKGKYIDNGIDYWEVIAQVILTAQPGESTRRFWLDYDVIMHQVVNHAAFVTIRSDWETGKFENNTAQATVISWNTKDNIIYPLEIILEKGNWWKGFASMFNLGMQHIKEGTDHLLFLIVLLLPAMLLVSNKRWGNFGGVKYSLRRLFKIVTAFTIGHSVTLLIGALGWLKLPQQPVEVLIAFSILVSAIHAVYPIFPGKEVYVAAGFGLVHGLAFATILANLKLGASTLSVSILGFNLGIELMQLFIIALIIPWLLLLNKTSFYKWFRIVFALLAAVAALAWIAERISGEANYITTAVQNISAYGTWCIAALAIIAILLYFFSSKQTRRFT